MNNSQRRILFILVLVCLGAGFLLIVMRPSQNQPVRPLRPQDDPAAEFKNLPPVTDSSLKIEWRVVIAKGVLKGKNSRELDCPKLDSNGELFLAELSRRYPDVQFSSPAYGEDLRDIRGNWFPRIKYPYPHPELGTLHVTFPVAVLFVPEKSSDRVMVVNSNDKYFNLTYDEIFFSADRQNITLPIPITPLFRPKQLLQKDGAPYANIGQTALLQSYSCYFQKRGKKLQPIDTHMLFYRLVKPAAP